MKLFLTFRLISRQVASAVPLSAAASCIIGYNGGVGRGGWWQITTSDQPTRT